MHGRTPVGRRSFLKATGGAVGTGLLAGCSRGGRGGGGGGDDAIVIGALQPLSGPFTPWGNAHRAGLAFAVDEINAGDGVLGRPLEVVETDTGSDAAAADSAFRRFVEQEDAVAVTGPVSSDVGIRTARTAQDLEVPLFLHLSGSNDVITPETTYTFRVGLLPAATTMRAQAAFVEDAGYSRVGAIVGDYAWGRSVEASIEAHFEIDVTIRVAPVGASDFKPFVRQFPRDLEMLIATGHPPGSLTITRQLHELGYRPATVTGSGFPPSLVVDALGDLAFEGVFTDVHNADVYSEAFAAVASRFAEETGRQFDSYTAYGYVTAELLAAAIEAAGSTAPAAIADATRDISFDTLFANPIEYSANGELNNQVQIYSQLTPDAPSYFPEGTFSLEERFRTDALPALAPEQ